MNRFLLCITILFTTFLTAQDIKSPSEFLGYELGTEFTRHHEVVDYYEYLAEVASDRVQLTEYGQTNERRLLLLAYVSSAANILNIESIREEHLKSANGEGNASKAIVWLSYNVHGNESVSTEASMQTIYELLTSKSDYLENTVVIMDPCINPDGRDRYSNWYNQYKNSPHQVDPNSKEHHEGWWTGRSNHYMFDLNRDWAWLTQVESQQRIKFYNKWMPHVHVDFHEMGVNNPYYFAPAAEPYHEVVTNFQRDFQKTIGKNHAKYFDNKGWFYFTKEIYDLFYPSYGDTYPTYNGAIGMTYEQGGSGRAGLGITTRIGDTLTLKDRIAHHHTTGLSTVEVAAKNVDKLNAEFKKFYQNKNYKYKSYVLNGDSDKIDALAKLLSHHEIEYGKGSSGTVKGFNYNTNSYGSIKMDENSIVVSTNQKKGTMVKVLFEPTAKLSDSLTYDITAWSLPYAYGLDAVASTTSINQSNFEATSISNQNLNNNTYAYVADWSSMTDARFLSDLLKKGIKVRTAYAPFKIEGNSFERGSLIITKADNQNKKDFISTLKKVLEQNPSVNLTPVKTGFVDTGKDFGSSYVQMIKPPKIAILSGEPTSTLRFGEIWYFFEQQLHYPLTVVDENYFKRVNLDKYDALILPGGRYGNFFDENQLKRLKDWVKNGGNLIAMGGAIKDIDGEKGFGIKAKKAEKDSTETKNPMPHENSQRERIKSAITGAIFKVKVDNTHPLAYGYGKNYFTLKLGNDSYDYLDSGNAVYLESNTKPISGFAGSEAQKKIGNSLVFGVESHGSGNVIYMVDNPLFRGFWENGKLFFANALFMVN
ncbi:M14 family metallopeptidase [Croceitalea sp. MTPC9]|uniref:M14 family metallopeptidase n=1 Tax=unclassified Croceitalea TaxID=2632280 RepID=UPI002B3C36F5|nr:M14 family metallopeptidase [Croceitalea sp. MTPC6]GMN15163.1 M14 family metallopeptidase [Croceitalea sp. MTPC9]